MTIKISKKKYSKYIIPGYEINRDFEMDFWNKIDFENTDILFFNPGEFKCIEYIIEALNKQKKELKKYIEDGKVLITIGTTGAVFAKTIHRIGKDDLVGIGFLDMICEERDTIHGDDLIVKLSNDMEIAGNQIQVMETKLNDENIKLYIKLL